MDAAQPWEVVRFVVGVPAVLVTLAYFLPGSRMRRRIKADAEVMSALSQGNYVIAPRPCKRHCCSPVEVPEARSGDPGLQ